MARQSSARSSRAATAEADRQSVSDRVTLESLQSGFKRAAVPSPRRCILVVVRDALIRRLLLEVLWLDGHEVSTAGRDEQLLKLLDACAREREPWPNLLVLDEAVAEAIGSEGLERIPEQTSVLFVGVPKNDGIRATAKRLGGIIL